MFAPMWQRTMRSGHRHSAASIVEILRHRAIHADSDSVAYSFIHGDGREDSLSFRSLDRRARLLTQRLAERTRPGDRVVIALQPGLAHHVALFACFYARLVAVLTFPPRGRRLQGMLSAICDDCMAALLMTDAATEPAIAAQAVRDSRLGAVPRLLVDIADGECSGEWDGMTPDAADIAVLQYTSGSTARPKGVMITHGNLIDNLQHQRKRYGLGPSTRAVIWLPPYHDMGLSSGILQPLYSDFPITLMSPMHAMQRPIRWLDAIDRVAATISGGPTFAYEACVTNTSPADREGLNLASWECAFIGAEPISFATLDRFARAFAPYGFCRNAFLPCYGLAEATLLVSAGHRQEGAQLHPALDAAAPRVNCGQAIDGHDVLIVDPHRLTVCSDGEEGEIWVSGPSVAAGYWNDPERTEALFGARLADGRGPFLRSGDLGIVVDGALAVTGRIKDVVIFAGRKLHAEDIEATIGAIEDEHLRAGGIAAFAVEIDGLERLVIVAEQRRSALTERDRAALRTAIVAAVARDHDLAVHDAVLCPPGSLPRTSSGKIRRHLCRDEYLSRYAILKEAV
jgi:acyl-CoA synthetase (AMP-forming)/AMP-acid ligase II